MSVEATIDCHLSVDGTDLSDYVTSLSFTAGAEALDISSLDTDSLRKNMAGLKTFSLEIEFLQDYGTSTVDDTLWDLIGASPFTVTFRPNDGSVSSSNPEYSGDWVLENYDPVDNNVGEVRKTRATFQPAGTIDRSTS